MEDIRTWIEINKKALEHNIGEFLKLIPQHTRFMAIIKSNAYGHGLVLVAKLLTNLQPKLWFGVDSIVEALRLRKEGIKNPIFVLGPTLPSYLKEAASDGIILTVPSFESLKAISKIKNGPKFHLKIDTGMHRQGFLPAQIQQLIKLVELFKLTPSGIYTHFAAAKDIAYPTYTLEQMKKFHGAIRQFRRAGFKNLIRHAASSGGTLLFPQTHLDMVRVGMGIYGYWPSQEAKTQFLLPELKPVLTWKTIVAEVKEIPAGAFVGYDLTERVARKTKMAVLPIGYWHGYDRGLSSTGEVLIHGRRARVLGRVSMDMTVVDVTNISGVKIEDQVVLVGKQRKESILADDISLKLGTSHYEFLTRINPLIQRILI